MGPRGAGTGTGTRRGTGSHVSASPSPGGRGCAEASTSPSTRQGSRASTTAPVSPSPAGSLVGGGDGDALAWLQGQDRGQREPSLVLPMSTGRSGRGVETGPLSRAGSVPAVEGGVRMRVRFVSTDYSSLILFVRVEDGGDGGGGGEVTSLWALLGRWCLPPMLDAPPICPRPVFSACCSGVRASTWAAQHCPPSCSLAGCPGPPLPRWPIRPPHTHTPTSHPPTASHPSMLPAGGPGAGVSVDRWEKPPGVRGGTLDGGEGGAWHLRLGPGSPGVGATSPGSRRPGEVSRVGVGTRSRGAPCVQVGTLGLASPQGVDPGSQERGALSAPGPQPM